MTCQRVLIMREGKILADNTPENLEKGLGKNGQVIAEIAAPAAELKECLDGMPEILSYNISASGGDYHRCSLSAAGGDDLRPRIFSLAVERGWKMRELSRRRLSLEDIYMRLTRPESEEEAS